MGNEEKRRASEASANKSHSGTKKSTAANHSGAKKSPAASHSGAKKSSAASHSGAKKSSAANHSGTKKSPAANHSRAKKSSAASHSGTKKSPAASHSGAKKSSAASHSGAKKSSAANHSGTKKSSAASHSGAKKSSAASHSGAKKSPAASHSGAKKSSAANHSGAKKSSTAKKGGFSKQKKPKRSQQNNFRRSAAKQTAVGSDFNERLQSQDERELHSSEYAQQLARRRRKRNYESNRRIRNFMYYAAIAIAVVSVTIIMCTTVLFNITEVRLVSDDGVPYSDEQIMEQCEIEPGQNLFTAPYDETIDRITTNLPYIETCEIKRKLPSNVTITVTSAKILGIAYGEYGQVFVLSTGCRALDVLTDVSGSDLTVINGVTLTEASVGSTVVADDQSRLDSAAQVVSVAESNGLRLCSVTFEENGYITANYDGRIDLYIGSTANLEEKLQLAAALLNGGKITKNESGSLDLTIDGRATFCPDYLIRPSE